MALQEGRFAVGGNWEITNGQRHANLPPTLPPTPALFSMGKGKKFPSCTIHNNGTHGLNTVYAQLHYLHVDLLI
jgi:hypothetical protein